MNTQDENGVQQNCFVVMPYGQDPVEQRWFKGWYEVVIKKAICEAGYKPILAAAEEQPGAINDEIRTHLAFDPMVVVDLGGMEVDDDPNPNVMYELGIRHALDLPLVLMAWENQRLPFDVSNQRVISERRDFLGQEMNRQKLVSFIKAADDGKYYRPMQAVGRIATIEAISAQLGEDSILLTLVQEVRSLRSTVASASFSKKSTIFHNNKKTIKTLLRKTKYRKELYIHFIESGGVDKIWAQILKTEISNGFIEIAEKWDLSFWKDYISKKAEMGLVEESSKITLSDKKIDNNLSSKSTLNEELIEQVKNLLPDQPWPTGVHKGVIEQLGISRSQLERAVEELIKRGVFKRQIDGVLIDDSSRN